jgi:hypothetical protein
MQLSSLPSGTENNTDEDTLLKKKKCVVLKPVKRFSILLIKEKRVGCLINRKPAKPKTNILDDRHGTRPSRGHTQHKPHTHHCKQASSSRLSADVIVITPPRASDSDFTEERPPRKIPLQQPHA